MARASVELGDEQAGWGPARVAVAKLSCDGTSSRCSQVPGPGCSSFPAAYFPTRSCWPSGARRSASHRRGGWRRYRQTDAVSPVNAAAMYLRRMHLSGSLALAGTGEPRCSSSAGHGGDLVCFCLHLPRSSARPVPRCFSLLTFSLDLVLDLCFAWVGAVLWSCFLTSPARRVGEVRKRLAERLGRHPARPAAVAAVTRGAQGPCGQAGECVRVVRAVCGVCAGGAWWRSLGFCPLALLALARSSGGTYRMKGPGEKHGIRS